MASAVILTHNGPLSLASVCNSREIITSFWACHFQARTPGCKSVVRVLFFMLKIYSKDISRARTPQTPQTPQTTPLCVIDAELYCRTNMGGKTAFLDEMSGTQTLFEIIFTIQSL